MASKPVTQPQQRSLLSYAVGDAVVTALFVFITSTFEELAGLLAPRVGIPVSLAGLAVLFGWLLTFGPVAELIGGPGVLFNPAHNVAFAIAGLGTVGLNAFRAVCQIVGAVIGSAAAISYIPASWQSRFWVQSQGKRPGVTLEAAFGTELALSFLLNLMVLWLVTGRANAYVKYWVPVFATLTLIVAGAELTGPSMNPAIAFGWFVHQQGHALEEHVLVYWLAPVVGAALAGRMWRWAGRPAMSRSDKIAVRIKKRHADTVKKKTA